MGINRHPLDALFLETTKSQPPPSFLRPNMTSKVGPYNTKNMTTRAPQRIEPSTIDHAMYLGVERRLSAVESDVKEMKERLLRIELMVEGLVRKIASDGASGGM
jgi:hypothetical protein